MGSRGCPCWSSGGEQDVTAEAATADSFSETFLRGAGQGQVQACPGPGWHWVPSAHIRRPVTASHCWDVENVKMSEVAGPPAAGSLGGPQRRHPPCGSCCAGDGRGQHGHQEGTAPFLQALGKGPGACESSGNASATAHVPTHMPGGPMHT